MARPYTRSMQVSGTARVAWGRRNITMAIRPARGPSGSVIITAANWMVSYHTVSWLALTILRLCTLRYHMLGSCEKKERGRRLRRTLPS